MRVRIVFDEKVRDDEPIYVISKAAELAGMHPQTLRQYDRLGLVSPRRAAGRGRRYSKRDVMQLVEIQRLSHDEGINLAGIKRIMDLENQVRTLEARVELLAAQANPGSRVFTAGTEGDVVSERRKALFARRTRRQRGSAPRGPFAPLQLTARVEEIEPTGNGKSSDSTGKGRVVGAELIEVNRTDGSISSGHALIVWTPDE